MVNAQVADAPRTVNRATFPYTQSQTDLIKPYCYQTLVFA